MFPKVVYRKGTGRAVAGGGAGEFAAEGMVVRSEEHLKSLKGEWVDSPELALEAGPPEEKPAKKAK